jgi:arylsulfatase A-like enzyme
MGGAGEHGTGEAPMARTRLLVALATTLAALAACGHASGPAGDGDAGRPSSGVAARVPVAKPVPPRTAKPNILLVMTDDMRADDLKWMPHTQRFFARRGTDFRNMFAPTPLCCPNRASYLSGEYAHNHHVWWHESPWGYGAFDDSHTIAGALQDAGYHTGYVGKYLNLYGIARPKADPHANPPTYVPAGWDDWRGTPDATGLPLSDPREGSTYNYFDTTINDNGRLEGHQGEYNSDVLVNESLDVLHEFEGSKQPWYLQLNSLAPHHGDPVESDDPAELDTPARPDWVKGRFDAEIPRGLGVPEDGQPERDVSDKAWITRHRKPFDDTDRSAVLALSRQRAETLFALDRQLARVLRELARSGELDDTIVAFTSDNGYMEGEHRWRSGKVIGFEPSYRVPLLIAGPGIPRGAEEVMPVNTVNLSASVLDWAGAHKSHTDGHSFVDSIGTHRGWDQAMGYEAYFPTIRNRHNVPGFEHGDAAAHGIRTAEYFYVQYSTGQEELFDLRKDPVELDSVAKDPAYAATKAELRTVLARFQHCKGDDCVLPLPRDLVVSETRAATRTDQMAAADARYYGR